MDSRTQFVLPPDELQWEKNNSKAWPKLMYHNLVEYLIHAEAYDKKEMRAFRSLYGYNYVQNGWMGDIWSLEYDSIMYIKTKISPSQPGVGRKDYAAWIAVSQEEDATDYTVETGYCTCPAGKARSCSHISAVIYAVTLAWANGVGGETCTDKQRTWGKGASQVLCPEKVSDIVFNRPNQVTLSDPGNTGNRINTDTPNPPQQFLEHAALTDFISESTVKNVWEVKGTMLYQILHAPQLPDTTVIETSHQDHCVDASIPVGLPLTCSKCQVFYDKYVCLDSGKVKSIELKTKNQCTNVWTDSRKLRITSSRVNDVPKTRRADPNRFVTAQIYPRFKGSVATRHGLKFEPIARAWYESTSGQTVSKSGIIIHEMEPYIAASPDGIINDQTILEIKCPTSNLASLIASGKYDVVEKDGVRTLSPKGRNGYYCQVQMAMFCTKSILCKFVVWTKDNQCILDVPYDKEFVKSVLPRVRDFYFKHLLVRLSDEFQSGRMKLSSEYKKLC